MREEKMKKIENSFPQGSIFKVFLLVSRQKRKVTVRFEDYSLFSQKQTFLLNVLFLKTPAKNPLDSSVVKFASNYFEFSL